jgi:nitroimidazol reductase NimA-like FMN-containing flavoprotein (pyridoxamine 5'-phosphate oxidase superfamily)
MKQLDHSARQCILDILHGVRDMTLATVRPDGYPQATTVSYTNDGLTLYIGIGLDGQKAHNIQHNNKVSLTVTPAYPDWNHIKGLSIGGIAEIVKDPEETRHAADCMVNRFPELKNLNAGSASLPWAGAIFVKITPQVISVLDYEKGFGHTDLYAVASVHEDAKA